MKRFLTVGILAAAVLATGCTPIETREVGVRVGACVGKSEKERVIEKIDRMRL